MVAADVQDVQSKGVVPVPVPVPVPAPVPVFVPDPPVVLPVPD